ncbi:hypothetical protein MSLAZ_3212 [Methanosarcina lacustris Z-7289]|uniref:Squalene cyclase C-terminal domain-containing protein n=1 Tax=Methanosarcina lacustris Z-7289 TaxID=1434111 RepID=A0A0E3SB49_9EURY|nr:hypothetical protein [Methanosarcina lacustris]AKB76473.1 hypothetical protein MSLAZ_3212 [Methanosarcina lacustris Z-7289]
MLSNLEFEIVKKGFEWLSAQQIQSVKELANTVSAHAFWGLPDPYITRLILKKEGDCWNSSIRNSSIRDTARACSALSTEGIIFRAPEKWLISMKKGGAWNEDVYDTAYSLGALADMEISDREGCDWLYENYGPAWEQVGTTSLIITALKKQEKLTGNRDFEVFIRERAEWVLSKKGQDGGWEHISTSNLAIQALLLAGFKKEVGDSINWLLGKARESGAWGNKEDDINATALALSTLGIYEQS